MKKLAVFAGILISVMVTKVNAQPPSSSLPCFNGNLQGIYSFVASGTFGGSAFAAAGQTTYDGNGGVTGVIQIAGVLPAGAVSPVIPWTGTYTVNSDCTITKTAVVPGVGTLHFFITAGNNFTELRFIATDTGTAIAGTATKR